MDYQRGQAQFPGDWGYWQNGKKNSLTTPYNSTYNAAIQVTEFYKRGWLESDSSKKIYYWSGENAFYLGDSLYEGLGVTARTDAQMRDELRERYNDDLAKVIAGLQPSSGIYNGLEIKTIEPADALAKINFVAVKRLRH